MAKALTNSKKPIFVVLCVVIFITFYSIPQQEIVPTDKNATTQEVSRIESRNFESSDVPPCEEKKINIQNIKFNPDYQCTFIRIKKRIFSRIFNRQ